MQVLVLTEPDYGRALRRGFLAASGDVVVNFDVDWCDLAFTKVLDSLWDGPRLAGVERHGHSFWFEV